jgi:peptidyl-prolyl cis-trans isomerase SurA
LSAKLPISRVLLLSLVVSLVAGGCGWLSRSTPVPAAPASEAAREAELRKQAAEAARPTEVRVPHQDAPDIVDRVLAVVNNDVITLSELQDSLALFLYESKETVRPEQEEAIKERLLRRMIESRLQLQEAAREQLTVDEADVNEQLAEVMKRFSVKTEEELAGVIKAQGLTVEGVKKRLRDQVLIQKVIRRKVQLRVSVTEQEIDAYVLENREKLETGLSYRARHILVVPKPGGSEAAWEDARASAEEVWTKVRAGEDFGDLAGRYSEDPTAKEGGDLGVLKQGELAADIEGQILRLRQGEASAPYRSRFGFHIFKLEWKESLSGEALAQAKQQIRDVLFRQKYAARLETWVSEIRKRAIIEIRM